MKKLVLAVIVMLLITVPMFAVETESDQITISLTIAAGTSLINNTIGDVTLDASSTGAIKSAGTITFHSATAITWYFVLESLQAAPNKGFLKNANGDTFAYTVSFGSISESAPVALTSDREGTISVTTPNNDVTTALKIHYGSTAALPAGTYTDSINIKFYDSDPTP